MLAHESKPVLVMKQILIRTLASQEADSTGYHPSGCLEIIFKWVIIQFVKVVLYVVMKIIVQANIKRQKHQTSLENVMLMSAKAISSDIIPIVNQRENRLYDIFAMKVAFSSFHFVFRTFLLTFYLF